MYQLYEAFTKGLSTVISMLCICGQSYIYITYPCPLSSTSNPAHLDGCADGAHSLHHNLRGHMLLVLIQVSSIMLVVDM
jgi:hypothetical protein